MYACMCVLYGLKSHKCASYNSTNVGANRHDTNARLLPTWKYIHQLTNIKYKSIYIVYAYNHLLLLPYTLNAHSHTHTERIRYWQKWNVIVAIEKWNFCAFNLHVCELRMWVANGKISSCRHFDIKYEMRRREKERKREMKSEKIWRAIMRLLYCHNLRCMCVYIWVRAQWNQLHENFF